MTELTKETLERVAQIARLKLSVEETEQLSRDCNDILDYFKMIDEIESGGKELYYIRDVKAGLRKDDAGVCDAASAIRAQFNRKKESGEMLSPKSL